MDKRKITSKRFYNYYDDLTDAILYTFGCNNLGELKKRLKKIRRMEYEKRRNHNLRKARD